MVDGEKISTRFFVTASGNIGCNATLANFVIFALETSCALHQASGRYLIPPF
jgi:hypothetical protein